MLVYKVDCTDPKYNLATEEYLTVCEKFKEPILFLWQNHNTIVVGRNQNAAKEINLQNANLDDVAVIRRNTGGGTVFHDLGNLNFSIIYTDSENNGVAMFEKMLEPIITTLNQMQIPAQFSGRNDIVLNGKKISGNAMWKYQNRFLQHGTILFNANLDKLVKYLTVDKAKILSKNIESITARVTNINAEISKPITIAEFITALIKTYQENKSVSDLKLEPEDLQAIEKIYQEKYQNPDWTFKKNATFTYQNNQRLEGKGSVEVYLNVIDGVINDCKIYGDFLGYGGTEPLEAKLIGVTYQVLPIKTVLENVDIKTIFGAEFTVQEILDLIIQ
ncbi:lipoate protein ligase A [Spiroplasma clarkii]|uniref:lipoate--protein ligase n=1 Tax=Spiroplasma clarkii TaxID=2139 RepID=A0A1Y0KZB6_9MOLU|nr:lipoate--protein ligase [Spiroplasma clarkii]ARU91077.1 lipoate protein ligase A [Spiroplasma clarkii]ATX70513.1 lipoate protein ligase A [Spiroplasma clarkii]